MALFEELEDFDNFFFYGLDPIDANVIRETQSEIAAELLQPRRSAWYFRSYGVGVPNYENSPIGVFMQIGIPFDVVQSMTRRNDEVTNGQNGLPDRRIAVSQDNVRVDHEDDGTTRVAVNFVPLITAQKPRDLEGQGIGGVV